MDKALRWGVVCAAALAAALASPAAGPAAQVTVSVGFDNRAVQVSRLEERFLEIEVAAPEAGLVRRPLARPRLNVALVVDRSGSMAEARKLDYVREAAHRFVDALAYGDRFALVTYDDAVEVPIPSEALDDRGCAHRVIDGLRPGGATNLGGGLAEGFRQVRRHLDPGAVNRVLLLSDGLANRGLTSPDELSRTAAREGEAGVSLTTFGVGLEFNEDLLSSLAESGRGTYYYIDEPRRVPELLAREFSTLEEVYASDVEITIEVLEDVEIREFLGYRHRREGRRYVVTIGDLAAGERRRVMCRVAPPRRPLGLHRLGEVVVRYRPAGERRVLSASQRLELRWLDDEREVSRALDRDVSERSAVNQANVARQKAAALVDRGDVAGATQVLRESRASLAAAPAAKAEAVRRELDASVGYERAIAAPMAAEEKEALQKDVKYKSYRTLQQR